MPTDDLKTFFYFSQKNIERHIESTLIAKKKKNRVTL